MDWLVKYVVPCFVLVGVVIGALRFRIFLRDRKWTPAKSVSSTRAVLNSGTNNVTVTVHNDFDHPISNVTVRVRTWDETNGELLFEREKTEARVGPRDTGKMLVGIPTEKENPKRIEKPALFDRHKQEVIVEFTDIHHRRWRKVDNGAPKRMPR